MTSIIIPTYNEEHHTIKCFESILKHTDADEYTVIWADDGSTQESFNMVRRVFNKFKNKHIIRQIKNKGFIKNVNSAIQYVAMFYPEEHSIILLNNDTEVTEGWLPQMVGGLKTYDIVGAVTASKTQWQSYHGLFKLIDIETPHYSIDKTAEEYLAQRFKDCYHKVSGVSFFCAAFRGGIFKEVGRLDEQYEEGYGEDTDFCKRAIDSDKTISIALGCFIYHHHHGTFEKKYSKTELKNVRKKHLKLFKEKHNIKGEYVEYK